MADEVWVFSEPVKRVSRPTATIHGKWLRRFCSGWNVGSTGAGGVTHGAVVTEDERWSNICEGKEDF